MFGEVNKTSAGRHFEVLPKPDDISWEEITRLLHSSYSTWNRKGLDFVASNQSVEQTINRVGNGVCLVAVQQGRLVGTLSYQVYKNLNGKKKWYVDACYLRPFQVAVHPDYMNFGLGKLLWAAMERAAANEKVDSIIVDTSVEASWLVRWYERLGYLRVDYVSHKSTNYYSVVLRKPLMGYVFNRIYCRVRYLISKFVCSTIKSPSGELRPAWKFTNILRRQ